MKWIGLDHLTNERIGTLNIFGKIQNSNGAVKDPKTGDLITPGSCGYAEAALDSINLFSSLGTLSTSNGNTITSSITSFSDAEMIAP